MLTKKKKKKKKKDTLKLKNPNFEKRKEYAGDMVNSYLSTKFDIGSVDGL